MANKDFDLLVVGEINPDLILQGDEVRPGFGQAEKLVEKASLTIGSSSAILACGAARLGLKTAFVGVVGDDLFGHYMLDAMQSRNVNTSACIIDRTLATGFSIILSEPDDRAILTYAGSIASLCFEDINLDLLERTRHLHLSSYFLLKTLRPDIPKLFRGAKELGLSTSLDTNWDPSGAWNGGLQEVFPHVDVLLPNKAEALHLSGEDELEAALETLAGNVPLVAVKLGAQGAVAKQGAEEARAPILDVEVVDTTGAGDSFDAGFLYGFLNDGSLEKSLRLACACGSLSTRAVGGTAAQATLEEALEVLDT